jgi:peptidoglycan/xylan/chitin deacetylase (PgdA/CDA1 family)
MRQTLTRAVHWIGRRTGLALRRARQAGKPRILMYHAIGADDTPVEIFIHQLQVLRREFDLVSLAELLDRRAQRRATGDEVAITFDDGVRNHVTAAYPVLLEHRAPATFFVCPGLMDSGRWIWNTELRVRLRLLSEFERGKLARALALANSEVEAIIEYAKRLKLCDRQQLEADVQARTREFTPSEAQVERYAAMSWTQASTLDPRIVTLGSHGVTHSILTSLTQEQKRVEIASSRELLERRLGRSADVFCYPNGDHDPGTVALVRDNYRAAVATQSGLVAPDDGAYLLPRIAAAGRMDLFMRRLHRPAA